jgi:hypothetical protein
MNGHELIEMIRNNCNLDNEVKIELNSDCYVGKLLDIKNVETDIERSPYDGDFDKSITKITLDE